MANDLSTRIHKKTEIETLVAHIQNPAENPLPTKKLEERLHRVNVADNLIQKYVNRNKVLDMLKFKFNYSRRSAERDYYDSKKIFGSMRMVEKKYDRVLYYEKFNQLGLKCADQGKHKEAFHYFNLAYKYGQLWMTDDDLPQHLVEPHTIILTDNPELLGLERIKNLKAKKSQIKKKLKKKKSFFDEDAVIINEKQNARSTL